MTDGITPVDFPKQRTKHSKLIRVQGIQMLEDAIKNASPWNGDGFDDIDLEDAWAPAENLIERAGYDHSSLI